MSHKPKRSASYVATTAIARHSRWAGPRSDFFVSEVALLKLLFVATIRSEYIIYIYIYVYLCVR